MPRRRRRWCTVDQSPAIVAVQLRPALAGLLLDLAAAQHAPRALALLSAHAATLRRQSNIIASSPAILPSCCGTTHTASAGSSPHRCRPCSWARCGPHAHASHAPMPHTPGTGSHPSEAPRGVLPSTLASNSPERTLTVGSCPVPLAAYAAQPMAVETSAACQASQPLNIIVATVPVPAVLAATNLTNDDAKASSGRA